VYTVRVLLLKWRASALVGRRSPRLRIISRVSKISSFPESQQSYPYLNLVYRLVCVSHVRLRFSTQVSNSSRRIL
jgi:hypothetical protein